MSATRTEGENDVVRYKPTSDTQEVALGANRIGRVPDIRGGSPGGVVGCVICAAIDPGLADCGWGVVVRERPQRVRYLAHGCVSTSPADGNDLVRARIVAQGVAEAVLHHAPAIVSLEHWVPYADMPPIKAYCVGLVTGAILHALGKITIESAGTAQQWRTGIGLSRKAPKSAIAKHVARLLKIKDPPRPSHAADALGMAIALAFQTVPSRMVVMPCEHGCSPDHCPSCSTGGAQ
jgi:crossover junction endodeoxyribonuclease RuvC